MKLNLKKMALTLSCLFVVNSAHAYKFIIYTDESPAKSALKVSDIFKNTYPFSKFIIDVEIVIVSPSNLKCDSKDGIDRLIGCKKLGQIQRAAMKSGGDQAIIIKKSPIYGGSSSIGGVPTITTSTPTHAIVHEYMHAIGLGDEYEYAASEAKVFCKKLKGKVSNYVFIDPLDPYASDSFAKSKHMGQIPWASDIKSNTPITNTNGTRLGTENVNFNQAYPPNLTSSPSKSSELIGLYKGKVCINYSPLNASWQPGSLTTVMDNSEAGLGPALEKIVETIMTSKGAKLKPIPSANIDVIDGESSTKINNSSMIKTFESDGVNVSNPYKSTTSK